MPLPLSDNMEQTIPSVPKNQGLFGKLAPGLVSGGLGLIGTFLQNRANKKLAQYSFNKNVEMWRMQNEYNAPKAQMKRLQEAGLNPNLIYGKGTVGNAQTMPQYQALPTSGETFGKGIEGVNSMLQTAIAEEQVKQQAVNTWIAENAKGINLQKLQSQSSYEYSKAETERWKALGEEYRTEIERIKMNFWTAGISPTDTMWLRLGLSAMQQLNAPQWIKDLFIELPTEIKQAVEGKK